MNALMDPTVGEYLNRHFVSTYQKVGAFRIRNGVKTGGNVASYFCTPEGRVLHAIAGPVDSTALLRESRWVNEAYQLAQLKKRTDEETVAFFRKAHVDRLRGEYHLRIRESSLPKASVGSPKYYQRILDRNVHLRLNNQGKVHLLLAISPMPRLGQIYESVFERILNEKVTTNPVKVAGGGVPGF